MNKNPSATWIGQESCLLPGGESPLSAGMCNSHQKSTYVLKNKFPLVTNPIKVLARVCMLIILPASWHCTLVIYSLHSGAGHIDKSPDTPYKSRHPCRDHDSCWADSSTAARCCRSEQLHMASSAVWSPCTSPMQRDHSGEQRGSWTHSQCLFGFSAARCQV